MQWIALFFFLFCAASAKAQDLLPAEQWNDETRLWLARAMVSEADWSIQDHAAIAWTLYRRWKDRHERDVSWTLLQQIRAYCAGFKMSHGRAQWVMSLDGDEKPEGWNDAEARWDVYRPAWLYVLEFSQAWSEGKVRDPCRGRSRHWGGPMDKPRPGLVPVDCGMTRNIFYAHDM